jgi:hypothetical protein
MSNLPAYKSQEIHDFVVIRELSSREYNLLWALFIDLLQPSGAATPTRPKTLI